MDAKLEICQGLGKLTLNMGELGVTKTLVHGMND